MKRELLFTRNDGKTGCAVLEVRKEDGCYSGYAKIGKIRKRVLQGFVSKKDVNEKLVRLLGNYREHIVVG